MICHFAEDSEISLLMITAGFGRVADFEFFHTAEIKNMISVNAIAAIQILRIFYDRIKDQKKFLCLTIFC